MNEKLMIEMMEEEMEFENFDEILKQLEELKIVAEIIDKVENEINEHNLSIAAKETIMSMLFDVIFKENSVEEAQTVAKMVKKVNEECGVYDGQ